MTREELRAAGHDVGAAAYARLAEFVRLLMEENARLNLTAAKTAAEIWRGHVCDSLALAGLVSERRVQALLDLGSGGGLPGVPVACVCEGVRVTLLDATRKKVDAAARMIARLGLSNATALWGRAEVRAHAPAYRERFDAVTSRAVAELPVLLEYAAGFVRSGGECWFFKSAARAAEERAAAQAPRPCVCWSTSARCPIGCLVKRTRGWYSAIGNRGCCAPICPVRPGGRGSARCSTTRPRVGRT